MKHYAEALSLLLTVPTIILGVAVVWKWRKPAWKAFKHGPQSPTDWLILGVAISFLGASGDNTYWGFAWGSKHVDHISSGSWFSNGVYSNIPMRQLAGIIAAYCHLKSAACYFPEFSPKRLAQEEELKTLVIISLILGVFLLAILSFL